tara:strand:+ start:14793 stop:15998 length:1206 start_codon:yes stop_codon:yes gene_type:complete
MKVCIIIFLSLWMNCLFAQNIQEENISFSHKGCAFSASISYPSGNGPFPAIMLVPGSGQNDKDGSISLRGANSQCLYPGLVDSNLTIYKDLAHGLSKLGYLVLRYDELFISCPSTNTPVSDYEKLWLPANAALDSLVIHPLVDANKLYLMGHSEGGSLINYIATERNDIAALINIAGAYTPFDSLLAKQLVDIANLCGGNVTMAQNQANQILSYFSSLRNGTSALPPFAGATASAWIRYIHVNDSVLEYYKAANLPTLFLGMANDFNVPAAEWNRFKDSLSPIIKNSFYQLSGLNHYMTNDSVPQVDQRVVDTIHYFLSQGMQVGLVKPKRGYLKIYPNPSRGEIHIGASESFIGEELEILTSSGSRIFKTRLQEEIDLILPYGTYLFNCGKSQEIILVKP